MQPFAALSKSTQIRRLRRLAIAALPTYPLDVRRLVPVQHWENTVFRVETGSARYALRIHRPNYHQSAEIIQSELLWLRTLRRDAGLIVPEPVETRDGLWMVHATAPGVPEPRWCVLFRWVHGRFMAPSRLGLSHLERVGAFMARLHRHSQLYAQVQDYRRPVLSYLDTSDGAHDWQVSRNIPLQSPSDVTILHTAWDSIQAKLNAIGRGPEHFGLIHADLDPFNYLFCKGEVRAIDFDDCGWGHYLYDIAVSLTWLRQREDFPALRTAFLFGYRTVRDLTVEDEARLPLFYAAHRLIFTKWFVGRVDHPTFRARAPEVVAQTVQELKDYMEREKTAG